MDQNSKSTSPKPWVDVAIWAIMVVLVTSEVAIRLYSPMGNYIITISIWILVVAAATLSALFHLRLLYEPHVLSALLLLGTMSAIVLLLASVFGG